MTKRLARRRTILGHILDPVRSITATFLTCRCQRTLTSSQKSRLIHGLVATNLQHSSPTSFLTLRSSPSLSAIEIMFFIAPKCPDRPQPPPSAPEIGLEQPISKRKRLGPEEAHDIPEAALNYYRKRSVRACDRCRLKKTKCSGGKICARCKQDGVVCVTTSISQKGDSAQNPRYTQLVESQRDQLARALQHILQNCDPSVSTKLKSLLADMGIATNHLNASAGPVDANMAGEGPHQNPDPAMAAAASWQNVFDTLGDPQLQALESFCTATPEIQPWWPEMDIGPSEYTHFDMYDETLHLSSNGSAPDDVSFDTFNQNTHSFTQLPTGDGDDPMVIAPQDLDMRQDHMSTAPTVGHM